MKRIAVLFIIAGSILILLSAPSFAKNLSSSPALVVSRNQMEPPVPDRFSSGIGPALLLSNSGNHNAIILAYDDTGREAIGADEEKDEDYLSEEEDYLEEDHIADPFEPLNRIAFQFNDKLYFWVLKPVAQGYSRIVVEDVRIAVKNFFNNIATPIRFVNCFLQLKFKPAGNELLRFGINTSVGILGLFDVARDNVGIQMQEEDLGQTLGVWGAGTGFYITWPILGPSSLRDTLGYAGDYFLDPVNYVNPMLDQYAIKVGDRVNRTSLSIGDYEDIKKEALDPYSAVKDIYHQYRESRVDR